MNSACARNCNKREREGGWPGGRCTVWPASRKVGRLCALRIKPQGLSTACTSQVFPPRATPSPHCRIFGERLGCKTPLTMTLCPRRLRLAASAYGCRHQWHGDAWQRAAAASMAVDCAWAQRPPMRVQRAACSVRACLEPAQGPADSGRPRRSARCSASLPAAERAGPCSCCRRAPSIGSPLGG